MEMENQMEIEIQMEMEILHISLSVVLIISLFMLFSISYCPSYALGTIYDFEYNISNINEWER